MPLADPTPARVSACPVHFLWDGMGKGRVLVRTGFLGFLAAAMLGTCGTMMHVMRATEGAAVVAAVAAVVWCAGQLASVLAKRAAHSSP